MDYVLGMDFLGSHVLGADKIYTDKPTVKSVQHQLHALSVATKNSALDPYHGVYKDDGVIGSGTRNAVTTFNTNYGWPADGANITDGTLTTLKRQDVAGAISGGADAIAQLAQAQLDSAQLQAAAAQNQAAIATTPAAVAVAQQQVQAAQTQIDAAKSQEQMAKDIKQAMNPNFLTKEVAEGLPMWMALGVGVLVLGAFYAALSGGKKSSSATQLTLPGMQ